MSKFVELTDKDRGRVSININHIVYYFESPGTPGTQIQTKYVAFFVEETIDEVTLAIIVEQT